MEKTEKKENKLKLAMPDDLEKNKNKTASDNDYELSIELSKTLRNYFGKKPFVDVADVMYLIKKPIVTEVEINVLINRLGQYPYDEVEQLFDMFQTNVKPVNKPTEKSVVIPTVEEIDSKEKLNS
jgi:hypothetical protein